LLVRKANIIKHLDILMEGGGHTDPN